MKKIAVFGATSAIAAETCKAFAADGAEFFLVARNELKLQSVKQDLLVRGAKNAFTYQIDITKTEGHQALIAAAEDDLSGLDGVIIAYGTLGDQEESQKSFEYAKQELNTNFLSVVSLLTEVANRFESKTRGTIVVISSVAGDRGRQSNYVYGAAKGGLSIFLEGLRNRLYHKGVHVLTVKPGFVDTPMTEEFKKGPLWASPESVGKAIYKAVQKKRNVLYVPCFWWGIMFVIRSIPEAVFKRLRL
ncbi:MAG: SDR family oxidoreductase [Bdellovibrionota bacterium]